MSLKLAFVLGGVSYISCLIQIIIAIGLILITLFVRIPLISDNLVCSDFALMLLRITNCHIFAKLPYYRDGLVFHIWTLTFFADWLFKVKICYLQVKSIIYLICCNLSLWFVRMHHVSVNTFLFLLRTVEWQDSHSFWNLRFLQKAVLIWNVILLAV